jgi:hypothetical protein
MYQECGDCVIRIVAKRRGLSEVFTCTCVYPAPCFTAPGQTVISGCCTRLMIDVYYAHLPPRRSSPGHLSCPLSRHARQRTYTRPPYHRNNSQPSSNQPTNQRLSTCHHFRNGTKPIINPPPLESWLADARGMFLSASTISSLWSSRHAGIKVTRLTKQAGKVHHAHWGLLSAASSWAGMSVS